MAEFVYLTKDEVIELAPEGTDDAELALSEQYARYTIETIAPSFGGFTGSVVAYGTNSDILVLPTRVQSITSLDEDGEKVWYASPPVGFNNLFGYDIEVTESNYAVRIVNNGVNIAESEPVRVLPTYRSFRDGSRYEVYGTFGYAELPEEVEFATKLLIKDYFCKDASWRVKYAERVSASDWSIKFDPRRHNGTGNLVVDQILAPYARQNIVVI